MRKWWVVWPLYAGLMGFALGASFFFGMYGRNVTESRHVAQDEQQAFNEAAKSRKEESDEALAYYTLWLMAFTGVLAFATVCLGIATVLLYVTGEKQFAFAIRSAIRQGKSTKESVEVAKRSADIAEQALVAGQRAYVRVAHFPWLWRGDLDRPGKYFYDITPIVENGGNTQTVGLRINVNSMLRDTPIPDDFAFPFQGEPGFSLIGSRQTISASNAIILDDDLLAVQRGQKYFYVWGTITYRDVFPGTPERVTEFCTQISKVFGDPLDPRVPNNPKGTSVEIYFRIYPKHQQTT